MGHAGLFFLENKTGGFHYEGLSDATSKVVQIMKAPDANGVYEAIVEIGGKTKRKALVLSFLKVGHQKRLLKLLKRYTLIRQGWIILKKCMMVLLMA